MRAAKQPFLFDVPKDSPSTKERLHAFMAKHGIETHYAGKALGRENYPWAACLMPRARQFGYGVTATDDLFECVAKVGRLLEEAGVLVEGQTEREAVEELCRQQHIQFNIFEA